MGGFYPQRASSGQQAVPAIWYRQIDARLDIYLKVNNCRPLLMLFILLQFVPTLSRYILMLRTNTLSVILVLFRACDVLRLQITWLRRHTFFTNNRRPFRSTLKCIVRDTITIDTTYACVLDAALIVFISFKCQCISVTAVRVVLGVSSTKTWPWLQHNELTAVPEVLWFCGHRPLISRARMKNHHQLHVDVYTLLFFLNRTQTITHIHTYTHTHIHITHIHTHYIYTKGRARIIWPFCSVHRSDAMYFSDYSWGDLRLLWHTWPLAILGTYISPEIQNARAESLGSGPFLSNCWGATYLFESAVCSTTCTTSLCITGYRYISTRVSCNYYWL